MPWVNSCCRHKSTVKISNHFSQSRIQFSPFPPGLRARLMFWHQIIVFLWICICVFPSECWFIDVWCCWLLIYSPNSIVTRFSGAHDVFDFLFSYFDSNGLEKVSKCVSKKKTLMTKAIVNHVLDDEVQHSPRVHGRVLWCPGILHRRSLPSRSRYLHRRFPSLLRIDRK